MGRTTKNQYGFTVLELVVAIVLIAILVILFVIR